MYFPPEGRKALGPYRWRAYDHTNQLLQRILCMLEQECMHAHAVMNRMRIEKPHPETERPRLRTTAIGDDATHGAYVTVRLARAGRVAVAYEIS